MKKLCFPVLIFVSLLAPALAASNNPELKPQIAFAERGAPCLTRPGMSLPGDVLIMEETFESSFPSGLWSIDFLEIEAYWDDINCASAEGSWSAWCAAGGSAVQTPCTQYANDMSTWMIYGPFDLSDAIGGYFDFYYWTQGETGYDDFFFGVSPNSYNFYGYTVDPADEWTYTSADFAAIPGYGSFIGIDTVWIGYNFFSDSSNTYEGAYIDYIDIFKTTSVNPTPTPDSNQPIVMIDIPTTYVHPFDDFWIDLFVNVPSAPLADVNLVFMLDIYGDYFFWPSWTHYPSLDWQSYETIDTGDWYIEILPLFQWPDTGRNSTSNMYLYGMFLDDSRNNVISNVAIVNWGYGP